MSKGKRRGHRTFGVNPPPLTTIQAGDAVTWGQLRSCTWKVRFPTRAAAKEESRRHNRSTRPYRCDYCGGFHLARKPNRRAS